MKFSKWILRIAGLYGLIVLVPQYFWEERIGVEVPPAITHPEFFYGFLGVAVAWQVVFLIIASDPVRFRPMILAGVIEKLAFGIARIALLAQGRLPIQILAGGMIDLVLGALFSVAWWKLRPDGRV